MIEPELNEIPRNESSLSQNRGVVRAAAILAVGNVASRVLGMARETVKANLFGASGLLSAFEIAAYIPTSLFDLIIGGMVNSSLVPVFSDYAAQDEREGLWPVLSSFLTVSVVILLLVMGMVILFAPQVAWLVGAYNLQEPALTAITIRLMRLSTPAVLFLSLSSILSGALFALKRFTLPAFTIAVFNGTIVVVALLRPGQIESLVWGLLLGSFLQVILQLPGLRDARLRWQFDWRHPAIRRVLGLYAPIVAGLLVNQLAVALSYNLVTRTGDESLTYMRYATTLYQFPLGLVVTAISLATLPTLSQQANGHEAQFKQTLAEGIRLVIALILPATAGLFALAMPIVALLFEHGRFTAQDTQTTAIVLRFYLAGLPFAAVDQMLVFASYARKDTFRPALVGVIAILIYLGVAASLLPTFGLLSLMIADAVKHMIHTLLMFWIIRRQTGGLAGYNIFQTTFKSLLAGGLTGLTALAVANGVKWLYPAGTFPAKLLTVTSAGMVGLAIYLILVYTINISEIKSLQKAIRK